MSVVETPTKSTADGPTKKLKSSDGFVITSNGNSDTAENEGKQRSSERYVEL